MHVFQKSEKVLKSCSLSRVIGNFYARISTISFCIYSVEWVFLAYLTKRPDTQIGINKEKFPLFRKLVWELIYKWWTLIFCSFMFTYLDQHKILSTVQLQPIYWMYFILRCIDQNHFTSTTHNTPLQCRTYFVWLQMWTKTNWIKYCLVRIDFLDACHFILLYYPFYPLLQCKTFNEFIYV